MFNFQAPLWWTLVKSVCDLLAVKTSWLLTTWTVSSMLWLRWVQSVFSCTSCLYVSSTSPFFLWCRFCYIYLIFWYQIVDWLSRASSNISLVTSGTTQLCGEAGYDVWIKCERKVWKVTDLWLMNARTDWWMLQSVGSCTLGIMLKKYINVL